MQICMWITLGEEREERHRLGVLRYCKAHELLIVLPRGQEDKRLNTNQIMRNFEGFDFCVKVMSLRYK